MSYARYTWSSFHNHLIFLIFWRGVGGGFEVSILEVVPLLMFATFFIISRRLGGGGWGLISKRLEEERVLEEARMREEEGRCGGAFWIFSLFLFISSTS